MKTLKTLVIHPKDKSTDFLSIIYSDKDWTVISDIHPKKRLLKEAIKSHDRIVMLGHGSQEGLMNSDFNTIIDSKMVYLLRDKINVAIW
jgi:hypothetical protein